MNVSITVDDSRLTAALSKLQREMGHVRPALRPMAERVVRAAREQIDTAGRRSGHPWPARATSTLKAITSTNRKGFRSVGLPLHATGRLFNSVGTLGGPDSVYEETDDSVTVGSRVPYARFHQTGTRRMPQRKIYDPTERDVREMARVAQRSFRERIEPLGFDWQDDGGEAAF